jgi:predicted dinucleotide-binding enzyme
MRMGVLVLAFSLCLLAVTELTQAAQGSQTAQGRFGIVGAGKMGGTLAQLWTPVAIPIAADDQQAIQVVSRLVRAAGYEPVIVGPLSTARRFDVGTPVYVKPMSASQLRSKLGLPAH